MLFNSLQYLLFFPLVSILFFLISHPYRWLLLLLASCYFYMYFKPIYILILFFTIVIDYYAGIAIYNAHSPKRKRNYLIISIVANVLVLAIFKYFNFINFNISELLKLGSIQNPIPFLDILLPIGLSFHTFQAMSYTIEVYRGNQLPEKHFGYYSLYVMFFPQLVAGPIERPQNILHQFHEEKKFNTHSAILGLRLILIGLCKKVIVADNLSVLVNNVYGNLAEQNGITLWIAAIFFSVQIYCDFSGYSDIAIGSAKVMGFDLMKNFNQPYFSQNIKEFWAKWHISLSTWFRDYLYIPLGGNRVSKWKQYRNTLLVFAISGLWHGANFTFMFWGFLHGIMVCISNLLKDWKLNWLNGTSGISKLFFGFLLFLLVTIAWVYFRAASLSDAHYILSKMLFNLLPSINALLNGQAIFSALHLENSLELVKLVLYSFSIFAFDYLQNQNRTKRLFQQNKWFRYSTYYVAVLLIIFCANTGDSAFIYFQF
jgi:alginate O-acetyltransferase complex protein AlgI